MADYEVRRRETVVRREPPVVEEEYVERDPVVQAQRQVIEDPSATGRVLVARIAGLIWLLFGALDLLIFVRIILKMIAANPGSGFAQIVYDVSGVFLLPFSNLVASPVIGTGVFEISSMIAIVVYALIAWVIVRLFRLVFTPARTRESITTYRRDY
ncbi:MAG TPA: YggT family protein [Phototrophicaceae bacterium]|nr:YggT family protein [Phototrophicaceae bacterium]